MGILTLESCNVKFFDYNCSINTFKVAFYVFVNALTL